MTDVKSEDTNKKTGWSRRDVLKAKSAGAAAGATPMFFTQNAWAEEALGNLCGLPSVNNNKATEEINANLCTSSH